MLQKSGNFDMPKKSKGYEGIGYSYSFFCKIDKLATIQT